MTLLSSAPTSKDILESIRRFYCGTDMSLTPQAEDVWSITRVSDGKTLEGVRVIKVRNRYRFEMAA